MKARRTIMIVGNGEIEDKAAGSIDAADLVVRFNDCRSIETGGSRTDVVAVCNTGRPAQWMLSSPAWRDNAAVKAASQIWSVRDPAKFAELKAPLSASHPELDDFCDDYTAGFAGFAGETGKRHRVIGSSVHDGVDLALKAYDPAPYVVPSSGMIVIADVLARYPDDAVMIAGFSHAGWTEHPFAAERQLVQSYISAGRLQRVDGHFNSTSFQGA